MVQDVLRAARRESIRQAAIRLADSGRYDDYRAIEGVLCQGFGVLVTRRLLVDPDVRVILNRRCAAAQARNVRERAEDD